MAFEIGICDDGIVCLKRDGNPISGLDAAHTILGPFLFPELQPKVKGQELEEPVYEKRGMRFL